MKIVVMLIFINSFLLTAGNISAQFKVGDCLINKNTDIWQNLYVVKIIKVGKYSYKTIDLDKNGIVDRSMFSYISFDEEYRYAITNCSNYKQL